MPPTLTEAQAQVLIPVPGSLTRGKKLAVPKTWTNLGADELSVWGECQGSGKTPYLVAAALTEQASKCNCPSPDKPCKHAAGLLLLYVKQPELFTTPSPDKLTAWHSARRQHATHEARRGQPLDPAEVAAGQAAAAARLAAGMDAKRQQRMVAGAAELAALLEDTVQQGFARQPLTRPEHWEPHAKRLVDNQLPALATALRELPTLAARPERLLARLGELYTLARAGQSLPQLPPGLRPEVLQQLGVTFRRDDLLAAREPVTDQWLVLDYVESDERDPRQGPLSSSRRTWLYGTGTGRYAMLYEYAHGYDQLPLPLPWHHYQAGGLVYYPGRQPLRAAVAQLEPAGAVPPEATPLGVSIGQLLAGFATAVAQMPWLPQYPVTLTGVLPAKLSSGERGLLDPATNLVLPVRRGDTRNVHQYQEEGQEDDAWYQLLADSAGQPCTVFGEWDGQHLRLLRSWPVSEPAPADLPTRAATAPTGSGRAEPWPTLVKAATVGTSTVVVPDLPGLPPAATPAQRLLLAAGTAALLQKTGYSSPAGAQPLLPDGPPETWPLLGPTGTALLRGFVAEFRYGGVAFELMEHFIRHQRRVPPSLLVPLLRSGAFDTGRGPSHLAVAGETGTWLMRQHPHWRKYFPPHRTPQLSGSPYDRRDRREPAPTADWQTRAEALAAAQLTVQPGADGQPKLKIKLLKSGSESQWLDLHLYTSIARGPKEEGGKWGSLLWQLLAKVPPRRWVERLGLGLEELLAAAAAHEYGRPLLRAWATAATLYADHEALALILAHYLTAPQTDESFAFAWHLVGNLSRDERIALARKFLPPRTMPPGLLTMVLYTSSLGPKPWPTDLAADLLPRLRPLLLAAQLAEGDPTQGPLRSLHEVISQHPAVPAELLPAYVQELTALADDFPAQAPVLRSMLRLLEFRQRLLASLDEPAG